MIALSTLSVASAVDSNEYKINGDTLTVHGIDFNMPADGYYIWDALTGIDSVEKVSNCFLSNDSADDLILISVWFDKKYDKVEEVSGQNTTVNGVTGVASGMRSGNVDESLFSYVVDGKQVNIMVKKGQEDLFKKVVKK